MVPDCQIRREIDEVLSAQGRGRLPDLIRPGRQSAGSVDRRVVDQKQAARFEQAQVEEAAWTAIWLSIS
jgi:hypothetical protein